MNHFAGLDVSVKDTSVCIVDETGKIVREVKVASELAALYVHHQPADGYTLLMGTNSAKPDVVRRIDLAMALRIIANSTDSRPG